MPDITLTQFFDFISSPGMRRSACVTKIKNKKYTQGSDYYKDFRDGVKAFHGPEKQNPTTFFKAIVENAWDQRKPSYKRAADGYKKFLSKNTPGWLDHRLTKWKHGELTVKVSPAWMYEMGEEKYLIKPHLHRSSLSRTSDGVSMVLYLMRHSLPKLDADHRVAMLDVGNCKLYADEPIGQRIPTILKTEAESFMSFYNAIEAEE